MDKWLENEPKITTICAVISAIALILSFTKVLDSVLPVDIAWIAIILCGVPILVDAAKGVILEHDIKADLLVSLALIASAGMGEYFAAGEVALIMQIGSLLEDYTSGKARESIEKLINLTAVILSAFGILTPVTGALWHNFGSVFVVVNAALLLREKEVHSLPAPGHMGS